MNLDRKIEIQQPVKVRNAHGELSTTWETFAFLWANVNHKGGREGFYAKQVVATGEMVFKIRYTSSVNERMRIIHDGKTYNIIAIAEAGRRQWTEITAKMHDNEY